MAWDKNEGVRGFHLPSAFRGGGGGGGVAPAAPVASAEAPVTEGRSFGFRNTGAFRERAMNTAQLATEAAGVGEPTSFRGGAGAPEPIGVTRGMTTTFSPGRLPGNQFAEPEMATPLQAQQVWNRGMRGQAVAEGERRGFTTPEATLDTQYGGFRAPGQTVAEVQATKEGPGATQERTMKGDLFEAQKAKIKREEDLAQKKQVGMDFDARSLRRWGTYKDGKPARPAEEHILRDLDEAKEYAMEKGDVKAGDQYMEWSKRLRELYPDVYATTMKTNPLAWRDIVVTHGPQIPATPTTAPPPASTFTQPQQVTSGQSPFSVGP